MPRNNMMFSAPSGVQVMPYRGDITDITTEAAVTREDPLFDEESLVTKALVGKHPQLAQCRQSLKGQTKILFFKKPYKLWTVKVSSLPKGVGTYTVFHAIMKQGGEETSSDWGSNMTRLYTTLLQMAEEKKIKILAIPLFGSAQNNAKTASKVLVDAIVSLKPKTLFKIFVVSKGKHDIRQVINCCKGEMVLTHGNQPEGGRMLAQRDSAHLPGYGAHGTITITFTFQDGTQGEEHPNPGEQYTGTTRHAYLPDCREGLEALGLLHEAFKERKLIFTVGYSETLKKENVVKYTGVPLKTSNKPGGPDNQRIEIKGSSGRGKPKTDATVKPHRVQSTPTKSRVQSPPIMAHRTQSAPMESQQAESPPMEIQPVAIEQPPAVQRGTSQGQTDEGRGNCMFVSLSRQIARVSHQEIGHSELRKKLVQYLKENPNKPDNTPYADFLIDETWDNYLDRMVKDGQWGDHIVLVAAAQLYRVKILVYKDGGEYPIIPNGPWSDELKLRLRDGRHYESVD